MRAGGTAPKSNCDDANDAKSLLQGILSLVKKVTDHAVGFRDIMDQKQ